VRNILRLTLTLAAVSIFSAVILAVVNSWTEPIIAERQLQDYLESVRLYFPDVADFEEKELEGNLFDLVYDDSGNLIGVIGKNLEYSGYGGPVVYTLAVDQSAAIVGYNIVSHSETPGLGDIITKPEFHDRFVGKTLEELDTVDTVSGATVSTSAIIGAIRGMTEAIAKAFLDYEEEVIDITQVPDGTYRGEGTGLKPMAVEVTVEAGRIVKIEVVEQDETPTYFVLSYPLIADRIIETQSLDVDTATGATFSATGIVNCVKDALTKALEQGGGEESEDDE